jgi:hypothetical protein
MWILEKNFPRKVLYVESLHGNARLQYEKVNPLLEEGKYAAVSSHLISMPSTTVAGPAPLVITFLRDPARRLISAYEFQKATNSLKEGDVNFRAFLTRLRQSPVSNYQTRLLSPQNWSMSGPRSGWDLNPRAIDLDRENLFVGTVELFDESMILLEEWLSARGISFDASYYIPSNTGAQQGVKRSSISEKTIFPDMIELDRYLWQEATGRIDSMIRSDKEFQLKLRQFASRREAAASLEVPIAGPDEFIRL